MRLFISCAENFHCCLPVTYLCFSTAVFLWPVFFFPLLSSCDLSLFFPLLSDYGLSPQHFADVYSPVLSADGFSYPLMVSLFHSARGCFQNILNHLNFCFSFILLKFCVCIICSPQINYKVVARRDGDVAAMCADPRKAEAELGWKAAYDLDDMCRYHSHYTFTTCCQIFCYQRPNSEDPSVLWLKVRILLTSLGA